MNKSAAVHARIDPVTKEKAEWVLKRLGLSPTDAIRLFYQQICLREGLPFKVEIPNSTTAKTLAKSQSGRDVVSFDSPEAMFESWEK